MSGTGAAPAAGDHVDTYKLVLIGLFAPVMLFF